MYQLRSIYRGVVITMMNCYNPSSPSIYYVPCVYVPFLFSIDQSINLCSHILLYNYNILFLLYLCKNPP